jgi:hypothetical protein
MEDVGYPVLWDVSDEADCDNELFKIRERQLHPDTFDSKIERCFNDQTSRWDKSGRLIEPLVIGDKKQDLVVNSGLIRIARLVTGKESTYFTYFASGTGVAIERPSDVILSSENYRVSMQSSGFVEAVGTVMKFVGKFPSFLPTAYITEGGAFDIGTTNGGTMLFRTLYPTSSRIEHNTGKTFYSLMQSINQVSIT